MSKDSKTFQPKGSGSSGQKKGPSPSNKQQPQKKKPNNRRSQRSLRRRRQQASTWLAPASVGSEFGAFFHRQIGKPVHKEWGAGTRFQGRTLFGNAAKDAGDYNLLVPSINQFSSVSSFTTITDATPFNAFLLNAIGAQEALESVASLHPYFINRLKRECSNWGRYVYRKIWMEYAPACSTSTSEGIAMCINHDVESPFAYEETKTIAQQVLQSDRSSTGPFWEQQNVVSMDYKGDKTYSATYPSISYSGFELGDIVTVASDLMNFVKDVEQYWFGASIAGSAFTTENTGNIGNFIINYVIDFYQNRNEDTPITDYVISDPNGLNVSRSVGPRSLVCQNVTLLRKRQQRLASKTPVLEEDTKSKGLRKSSVEDGGFTLLGKTSDKEKDKETTDLDKPIYRNPFSRSKSPSIVSKSTSRFESG